MPYSDGTLAQTSPHLRTPPTPLKPAGTCQHMPHRLAHANICALLPKSPKSAHPSAITQPPPLHPLANTYNPMHGLAHTPPHLSILNVSGQCCTPTYPGHTCNTCQHQARSPKHPHTNTLTLTQPSTQPKACCHPCHPTLTPHSCRHMPTHATPASTTCQHLCIPAHPSPP
jgi:hypothetical protein